MHDPVRPPRSPRWMFLTHHAHVLVCLRSDRTMRAREIAARIGLTEGAVRRIIADLVVDGVVTSRREGRRNRYVIHPDAPLGHPLERTWHVGDLLDGLTDHTEEDLDDRTAGIRVGPHRA